MTAKILAGSCLAALILAGCGGPDNTVAVPHEETDQMKTAPTPAQTKAGKPALNKSAVE